MAVGALTICTEKGGANGTVHSTGCFLIKGNTFRDNRRFQFNQNFRKFGTSGNNGTEIARKSFQKFRKLVNFRKSNHSTENSGKLREQSWMERNLPGNFFFENLGLHRLEFCLPFAQTVNWPVCPFKWLWKMVNNLYFRMELKKKWNLLTSGTDISFNILLTGQFVITFVQQCVMRTLSTVPNTQNEQKSFRYKNKISVGKHYVHVLHWNKTLPSISDN